VEGRGTRCAARDLGLNALTLDLTQEDSGDQLVHVIKRTSFVATPAPNISVEPCSHSTSCPRITFRVMFCFNLGLSLLPRTFMGTFLHAISEGVPGPVDAESCERRRKVTSSGECVNAHRHHPQSCVLKLPGGTVDTERSTLYDTQAASLSSLGLRIVSSS